MHGSSSSSASLFLDSSLSSLRYFLSLELWQLHRETSMLVWLKTFWFHGFPLGHLGFCYYDSSQC